jgi:Uma2 family endonuclease
MASAERRTVASEAEAISLEPLPVHRFSVEQYHRMIDAGVLAENDRVELLEGRIVDKMTHKPPHDVSVSLAHEQLDGCRPTGWILRIQSAITTPESEPEPDVALVRAPARRYVRSHPRGKDIGLLVEVADSSLLEDRSVKGGIYARIRVPFYWIINLSESKVEVYTKPKGGKSPGYSQRRDYGMTEIVPVTLDGREIGRIAVKDLLP